MRVYDSHEMKSFLKSRKKTWISQGIPDICAFTKRFISYPIPVSDVILSHKFSCIRSSIFLKFFREMTSNAGASMLIYLKAISAQQSRDKVQQKGRFFQSFLLRSALNHLPMRQQISWRCIKVQWKSGKRWFWYNLVARKAWWRILWCFCV